jgi:fructose/tagatose bisphosphate aldolase
LADFARGDARAPKEHRPFDGEKPNMSTSVKDLLVAIGGALEVKDGRVVVVNEKSLRANGIDMLVNKAVFGSDAEKPAARWLIWEAAQTLGIRPASIHELYIARGRNAIPHTFTTPAMNIRMSSYDTARAAIKAAVKGKVGAFIFEIARSEMTYTHQPPQEFSIVMQAAAIKEGFRGPLFIQGDHFQINAKKYLADPAAELAALKKLVDDAIAAGYYNIDIDTSTLVDLSKADLDEQQKHNYELCAMLSDYVRSKEPAGVVISLGGEIGEVGHKNSDVHEARAFMDGYKKHVKSAHGISKLSVNTGTSHGGTVLADGSIADVSIDFTALHDLSVVSREYGMGGAVQHGASTLPETAFGKFVESQAIEVHLATALQTLAFQTLPAALNKEIDTWLFANAADERKAGDTDEQFLYKTRKKAVGVFKEKFWTMPDAARNKMRKALETRFALLFNKLGVENTRQYADKYTSVINVHKRPEDFGATPLLNEDVSGLAD